ncbi:MAG: HD domain-containing protein [Spirochaetes bacterium]|nr:HD domain-containing protein [Spirochaetota bacterium]
MGKNIPEPQDLLLKLKKNYIILVRKFNFLKIAFKKSRLSFKRLLRNYLLLKRNYLFLGKHSTKKVRELIDEINQEKYQIIFNHNKQILKISKTFLEAIEMSVEEFAQSFYVDILFEKYLPAITTKTGHVKITPFQFPILIKNFKTAETHLHPYMYFKVSGILFYDSKSKKYFYQLSFQDISASVELDYFQKTDTLITSLSTSNYNLNNAMKNIEMHKIMLIFLTCSLIEEYNKETSEHLISIKEITTHISNECKRMRLIKVEDYDLEEYVKDINFTSVFHDIGKMGIPAEILFKEGTLTEEEKKIMHNHSIIGARYIQKIIDFLKDKPGYSQYIKFLQIPYEICLYHHERWDGEGYPNGLKGEQIPISARIVSIADTYDAVRANRIYDVSRSHEDVIKIITNESGKQFDPDIVKAFINISPLLEQIQYDDR